MSPRTIFVIAAGAASAALLGIFFHFAQERQRSEGALEIAQAKYANLASAAQQRSPTERLNSIEKARSMPAPTPPRSDATSVRTATPYDPIQANQTIALNRTSFTLSYGPLLQALGLPPEQADKLKDLVAREAADLLDLRGAAQAQGLAPNDTVVATLREEARAKIQAERLALLGSDTFQKLKEYNRTLPVRELVSQFAGSVARHDPLDGQQAERLTRALADTTESYRTGGTADLQRLDFAAADKMAETILTPKQLFAWKNAAPIAFRPDLGSVTRWGVEITKLTRAAEEADRRAAQR